MRRLLHLHPQLRSHETDGVHPFFDAPADVLDAVGDQGVYMLTITNTGLTPTDGMVTVTDTLPPGLMYLFAVGNGWSCSAASEIVTCTNPGPINPRASTTVTLTVRVEPQAWPGVTNLATVTKPGRRAGVQ